MWITVDNGATIESFGSENGITAPYSITCGNYGIMSHTSFAENEMEGKIKYQKIKDELQKFIDYNDSDETGAWCERFTSRW